MRVMSCSDTRNVSEENGGDLSFVSDVAMWQAKGYLLEP
jgi:hypothetical protein